MQLTELDQIGLVKLAEVLNETDESALLAIALIRLQNETSPNYEALLSRAAELWSPEELKTDLDLVETAFILLQFIYAREIANAIEELALDPHQLLLLIQTELSKMPDEAKHAPEREILILAESFIKAFIAGMGYQAKQLTTQPGNQQIDQPS